MEQVEPRAARAPTPRVFLSYARARLAGEAEALTSALTSRGAEVYRAEEPVSPDGRHKVASEIARADLIILLISPGDEASDWMQDEVRQILLNGWQRRETRVAIVAPAVGAIPPGLRHRDFVWYIPHDEARVQDWSEPEAAGEFADRILVLPSTNDAHPLEISDDELREWRNRLVHLGPSRSVEPNERAEIVSLLRRDAESLATVVARARAEGAMFATSDTRAVLDRALVAHAIGDSEMADAYYRLVVDMRKVSPSDRPDEGTSLDYGLGLIALVVGDLEGAQGWFARAATANEAFLGSEHPATIAAYYNLGLTLAQLGRENEAAERYEHALALAEPSLGADHPQTAAISYNLGILLRQRGDLGRARELFAQAAHAYERSRPADSPELEAALSHLKALR